MLTKSRLFLFVFYNPMAIDRYGDSVVNEVILPPVTMEDQGSTLTCQARNNNISTPVVTQITVNIRGRYCK